MERGSTQNKPLFMQVEGVINTGSGDFSLSAASSPSSTELSFSVMHFYLGSSLAAPQTMLEISGNKAQGEVT